MADDIDRLARRLTAAEQRISTEQAMRVALLTDITARLDMLEHRTGDVPPPDPAAEVPLSREEAEEIAKTCAQAAAARPDAPPVLTTVNLRGWRPQPWVVDAVVAAAGRARQEPADATMTTEQSALRERLVRALKLYDDDGELQVPDDDAIIGLASAELEFRAATINDYLSGTESMVRQLRDRRDQRDAMRAERDQALARVRELEEQMATAVAAGVVRIAELEGDLQRAQAQIGADGVRIVELQQRLAQASADTVQAMESAAGAAARVQELEQSLARGEDQVQALQLSLKLAHESCDANRERHDQLFAGAQQADQAREAEHRLLIHLRHRVGEVLGDRYENDNALIDAVAKIRMEWEAATARLLAREQISWERTHELISALGMPEASGPVEWPAIIATIAKLKAESVVDVMAKIEAMRGQVANMNASQQWRTAYEGCLDKLADALGMAPRMWTEQSLIEQVRNLKARSTGGFAHE